MCLTTGKWCKRQQKQHSTAQHSTKELQKEPKPPKTPLNDSKRDTKQYSTAQHSEYLCTKRLHKYPTHPKPNYKCELKIYKCTQMAKHLFTAHARPPAGRKRVIDGESTAKMQRSGASA